MREITQRRGEAFIFILVEAHLFILKDICHEMIDLMSLFVITIVQVVHTAVIPAEVIEKASLCHHNALLTFVKCAATLTIQI